MSRGEEGRGRRRTYTGHGGQMAVMAELLQLECNVAVPDVDYGTDLFAFRDDREDMARIQVKTSRGRPRQGGHDASFTIPVKQLSLPDSTPALYYALAVRLGDGRWDFLVISRADLFEIAYGRGVDIPSMAERDAKLSIRFRADRVLCGDVDLTRFRNAWNRLPPLQPTPAID
jgi:hypothetical protein